jgi:hypothetical protein
VPPSDLNLISLPSDEQGALCNGLDAHDGHDPDSLLSPTESELQSPDADDSISSPLSPNGEGTNGWDGIKGSDKVEQDQRSEASSQGRTPCL